MSSPLFQAFERALWFGDETLFPKWFVELYRDAGLSHILALSGQHVVILVVMVGLGVRYALLGVGFFSAKLVERFPFRLLQAMPLLVAGLLLVQSSFAPSVFRVFVLVASAWVLRERTLFASPFQIVCSALGLSILLSPEMSWRLGFQLSGTMTVFLVLLGQAPSLRSKVSEYVSLTLSLSFLSLPLTFYYFGKGNVLGPLYSLLLGAVWDVAIIPGVYLASILETTLRINWVSSLMEPLLVHFVDFHALLVPWVSASILCIPAPNLFETLCVEVWIFCVVSKLRNNAPSIDFSRGNRRKW